MSASTSSSLASRPSSAGPSCSKFPNLRLGHSLEVSGVGRRVAFFEPSTKPFLVSKFAPGNLCPARSRSRSQLPNARSCASTRCSRTCLLRPIDRFGCWLVPWRSTASSFVSGGIEIVLQRADLAEVGAAERVRGVWRDHCGRSPPQRRRACGERRVH